jgi:hypothetical protein
MANLDITNFETKDGVRGVKKSEQSVLTVAGVGTIKRLTILGRITADGKYGVYNVGDTPAGTVTPVTVLLSEVVSTGAGDYPCGVMLQGVVEDEKLIISGSEAGVGITEAIKDALRTFDISVESALECARLDNQ